MEPIVRRCQDLLVSCACTPWPLFSHSADASCFFDTCLELTGRQHGQNIDKKHIERLRAPRQEEVPRKNNDEDKAMQEKG